jgi:branched-chain amino acid transport system substrate-binding protein
VQAQDVIRIGGLLETSGVLAALGQPGLEGAELAIALVNAAGGVNGSKLELENINTESDNTKTVSAAKRLIAQKDIVALIGPMNSGSSFAIVDTVQRAPIALLSNGAARGIVLPPEQKQWIFLAPLTDVLVQSVMLSDMKRKGITRIALANADSAFGTSGREQLERQVDQYGIKIVAQQTFCNTDKDVTPQLTNIRGTDAQAVVVWSSGPVTAIAARNYRQLAIKVPLYLSHAGNDFNFVRLAGDAANDVLFPSSKLYVTDNLRADDPQKAVIEKFVRDYQTRFNRVPATFAGNGYDAAMMIIEALRKVGPDRARIRQAIEGLQSHVGVTAVYSYSPQDHFGARAESVVMLTIKDGKFAVAK